MNGFGTEKSEMFFQTIFTTYKIQSRYNLGPQSIMRHHTDLDAISEE